MRFLITFLEGLLSFISPCMLPMLPVYISYFGGTSSRRSGVFLRALFFVFGFTIIFCLLGLFAGSLGSLLRHYQTLVNIITGGTGMFKGAYGVLIGCTSGGGLYGTEGGMTLPQTLFKFMEGYIVVPDECETAALYEATQEISEDNSALEVRSDNYAMVPLTLRMQHGSLEEDQKEGLGIGTLLPYNAGALTVDYVDCPAAADYDVHDYVNDNWLAAYGEPEFMTFHIDDGKVAGDLYAYKFSYGTILDPSSDFAQTGTETAVFILVIDGTGDFEGVTAMLGCFDVTADPSGWGIAEYDNDLPLSHQTWAEGYMKVPGDSPAAAYGNALINEGAAE